MNKKPESKSNHIQKQKDKMDQNPEAKKRIGN